MFKPGLQLRVHDPKNYFSYFSTKTNVVGNQKNRLKEKFFWAPKTCVDGKEFFTILHPKMFFIQTCFNLMDKRVIKILHIKSSLILTNVQHIFIPHCTKKHT